MSTYPLDPQLLERFRAAVRPLDLSPGSGSRMTDVEATKDAIAAAGLMPTLLSLVQVTSLEDIAWCRLVILGPSQQIPAHTDPALPAGWSRHHIVLWTNERAWTWQGSRDGLPHNAQWQYHYPGDHYTMNPAEWHGAVNWGSEPRVHLLVDVLR